MRGCAKRLVVTVLLEEGLEAAMGDLGRRGEGMGGRAGRDEAGKKSTEGTPFFA